MKVIWWPWKSICLFKNSFNLTCLNWVFTYHLIKYSDNGPLSPYFLLLIPWSNRCFTGLFLLDFYEMVFFWWLSFSSVTFSSSGFCNIIPLDASLTFLWYANVIFTKEDGNKFLNSYDIYTILLIHYISNQRSVFLFLFPR